MTDDIPSKSSLPGYRFCLPEHCCCCLRWPGVNHHRGAHAHTVWLAAILGLTQTTIQYTFFISGWHTTGVNGSIMNATSTFFSVLLAFYLPQRQAQL